ncbi:MAG: AraC family transcriptional regulator [Alphaproteobacteria bacterium]
MEILDISLRAASGAFLLLGIFILLRDAWRTSIGRLASLFLLGTLAYLIAAAPYNDQLPETVRLIALIGAIPNIVFFWMLGRALFEDDYRPDLLSWGLVLGMLGMGLVIVYANLPAELDRFMSNLGKLIQFGLMAHVMLLAVKGRDNDLIERRRKFRLLFITVICVIVVGTMMVEYALVEATPPKWLLLVSASTIFIVTFFSVSYLVSLRADDFVTALIMDEEPAAPPKVEELLTVSPADKVLMERLTTAMETDRIWLDEKLNIGALATHLQTQEHRLRRVINQQLGFKNFSQFLNSYRVAEAQTALRDPEQAHLPILSIALGLGFGSIGTFNRAFKDQVGATPSDYRKT